jgi:guanosine-3',5'-bis(diphosphate) 3'-pyrophosphohydrolase
LIPEGYYDLVEKVSRKRREREAFIQEVIGTLKEKLNDLSIQYEIEGTPQEFLQHLQKNVYAA